MEIGENGEGSRYIYGEINIAEWVEGECLTPRDSMPKMTLKSEDGTYSKEMYVSYIGGISYYYDRYIDTIDTSKKYYKTNKICKPKRFILRHPLSHDFTDPPPRTQEHSWMMAWVKILAEVSRSAMQACSSAPCMLPLKPGMQQPKATPPGMSWT